MTLATQNISFNAVSSGPGNFVVASAYNILTPEQARVVDGKTYSYYAQSLDETQWESGSGAYTVSTHTLARTTIVATSNGNLSPVNFTLPPVVGMSESPSTSLEPYAAPFEALAFNGMQVNGSFDVSQEHSNTSFAVPTNTVTYAQDGFQVFHTSAPLAITAFPQHAAMPQIPNCLLLSATTGKASLAATDQVFIDHKIEGIRSARLGWGAAVAQPLTIGFFVFTTIPGTMALSVFNGAANRCYTTDVVIHTGNTWEYKTITIPGDTTGTWATDNTTGLWLRWCFGAGTTLQGTPNVWGTTPFPGTVSTTNFVATTSNQIAITGVVVLPGIDVPTQAQAPLIMRPFDQEIIQCQRQYEHLVVQRVSTNGTNYAAGTWPWKVTKRVTPILNYFDGALAASRVSTSAGGNGQTFTAGGLFADSRVLFLDSNYSGAVGAWLYVDVFADSRL